ncbi:MAG: GNAT family N-acetyltransferase [Candidatus Methanomethylophilaceae archaeon]|nr:GNAT family N-acetyltransferase [Candidatus Methanomethylophilaceae archaeon]
MPPEISYYSKPTQELSPEELEQCSNLYSNHYGYYSADDPKGRAKTHIRMSSKFYKRSYVAPGYRVAMAKCNGDVIGQAFYIREKLEEGIFTWVLQLVVHTDYRRRGIASRLLHSIWGFSNDCAWGLATTNPCTIKALESTTLRHATLSEIRRNEKLVRKICARIPYIMNLEIDEKGSRAFTDFYVDSEEIKSEYLGRFGSDWLLGELKSGQEWVAFTFRDQPFDKDFIAELQKAVSYSEEILREAYGRMDMGNHPWAKHTGKELDFIFRELGDPNGQDILDAGCGQGRYAIELSARCKDSSILGIDFSEFNIDSARLKSEGMDNVTFQLKNLKDKIDGRYGLILCLYDVIGSLPEKDDNITILKNLYGCCAEGGHLVLSVMNMGLTVRNAKPENVGDINAHPEILYNLPSDDIMQSTGDIFDPELYAVDTVHNLVYRKEQFTDAEHLPAEYVIRDKRYTMAEIMGLVESVGFSIQLSRFVQAGRWETSLDEFDQRAKEILIIARR